MLGLKCESNSEWITRVKHDAALLLSDHAHCEKKAALTAISLLNRYPERTELVSAMTDLAIEEMSHFKMVLKKMSDRSVALVRDNGDDYAARLNEFVRKEEPKKMLDRLIVASLIEARSCERFALLASNVNDDDLKEFYTSLLASEARHRNLFLILARRYFPEQEVSSRLGELEETEAALTRALPSAETIHG
ncbi:MAG TPA: tRNA-(ms[2]io[6]A)-hydroxylase [Candidatus Kapabacteria bacterium]|nr:tRNA-(ms[2]io[6]A)-hydroxylase [Candidatus Kapabacteria bacterium]